MFLAVLSAGITGGVTGTTKHLQSPSCPLHAESDAIKQVLLQGWHLCSDDLSPTTVLGMPQCPLLAPHGLLR